jgi:hypothetical protein
MVGHHAGDRPGRPAGPVSTCSVPGLPVTRPTPWAWTSARVVPAARQRRSRDAGQAAALGCGAPRASQAGPTPRIPSRQARCSQATTPPADHGVHRPVVPNRGRPTTPSHSRVQRGADSAAAAPRTPGACPSGHLMHRTRGHRTRGHRTRGRSTSARPVGRTSPRRDRGRGQGNDRPGRRPDILATGDHPLGARPRPGHGTWGAWPRRSALR